MNRPQTYTIAAILQFVISVLSIVFSFPDLARGAAASQAADVAPYFITVSGFALGILGLVSAYGIWQGQKWGVILTIAIRLLDGVLALPGVLFAPTLTLKLLAITGVILAIVVIALLLWPRPRLAQASEQA